MTAAPPSDHPSASGGPAHRVAVVGATGFVGSHVVPYLAAQGHRVRAVSRAGSRRPSFPAGVETAAADVETGIGLEAAVRDVDAVVSLVAIPREAKGRDFETVNVGGIRHLLAAAHEAGVGRIVHLSALGVTDDPKLAYLSSKWRGEQLVRQSGLSFVALRPSLLFGTGDGFFTLIETTLKYWSPGVVAIPGRGRARFQPLSVDDLAIAVDAALRDDAHLGQVIELGGPEIVTYRGIVDRVMAATGRRRLALPLPVPIISALTALTDRILPAFPVSHDQIRSLGRPNTTDLDAFERAFGRKPRPFDLSYMRRDA